MRRKTGQRHKNSLPSTGHQKGRRKRGRPEKTCPPTMERELKAEADLGPLEISGDPWRSIVAALHASQNKAQSVCVLGVQVVFTDTFTVQTTSQDDTVSLLSLLLLVPTSSVCAALRSSGKNKLQINI